jgi:hypothetical protein
MWHHWWNSQPEYIKVRWRVTGEVGTVPRSAWEDRAKYTLLVRFQLAEQPEITYIRDISREELNETGN